jgi:hypothetical protein
MPKKRRDSQRSYQLFDDALYTFFNNLRNSAELSTQFIVVGTTALSAYSTAYQLELDTSRVSSRDLDILVRSGASESCSVALQKSLTALFQECQITFQPRANAGRRAGLPTSICVDSLEIDLLCGTRDAKIDAQLFQPWTDIIPFSFPTLSYLEADLQVAEVYSASSRNTTRNAVTDVVTFQLPSPARFAFQKLAMTLHRVGGSSHKLSRDLRQAGALLEVISQEDLKVLISAIDGLREESSVFRDAVNSLLVVSFEAKYLSSQAFNLIQGLLTSSLKN